MYDYDKNLFSSTFSRLGFCQNTNFPANYSGKASKIGTFSLFKQPLLINYNMYSYIFKNLIKNIANVSLKTPHLCFLNLRYFSSEAVKNNSTVSLFKNFGFTESQITSLLSKRPSILSLNEDKTIRPKLDLFTSYGFSSADIYHILVSDIEILKRSIKNQIIPCCEFLKRVARDNESFIGIVKRSTWVLKHDYKYNLQPNIELLRDYGVPEYRIERFLRFQPRALMLDSERFKIIVREVLEMGFEPVKSHFLRAVIAVVGLSKETRERKLDLYRKWGWTDDQILSAFRKQPGVLVASEEKVEQVFGFLIKEMGWSASEVWSCPIVIMHSLENWTMPRCFVVQFLLSKGALPKDLTLSRVIVPMENLFKERFVDKNCLKYPEVLNLYKRKVIA